MESHVYVLVHAKQPRLKIGKANNVFCRLLSLGLSKAEPPMGSFFVPAGLAGADCHGGEPNPAEPALAIILEGSANGAAA
jgi:hypothetical protein